MTVRELLRLLLDHALDGRGATEDVLIRCDGELRTIEAVEVRVAAEDGLFILVEANGPTDVVEPSTTTRAPRA